jgi:hypothetical protein
MRPTGHVRVALEQCGEHVVAAYALMAGRAMGQLAPNCAWRYFNDVKE